MYKRQKILRVDLEDRKIGLSLKRAQWAAEDEQEETRGPSRGGLDGSVDTGTGMIDASLFHRKPVSKPAEPETTTPVIADDADASQDSGDVVQDKQE